ncbi:MAG: hypothetical protein U0W40_06035 [Acidimicrobiia bacterium]
MTRDPRSWGAGDARAWLDAHVNLETGVGVPARGGVGGRLLAVDRQRPLMELLGSPETDYPAIHLTGTNGKTSVARMTTTLLTAAGLNVGSYTSPHLERVNERMTRDGEPIDDATLDDLLMQVSLVEDLMPDAPSTSRSSLRPRCCGSATSRPTSRWWRWASAARATPPTS